MTELHEASANLGRFLAQVDQMVSNALTQNGSAGYPPYSIHGLDRTGNKFVLSMALAGFRPEDVKVTTDNRNLIVEGNETEVTGHRVLHRGIARRNFRRVFPLLENIEVGEATLENGLLTVELNRVVPEALKPRTIVIRGSSEKPAVDAPAEHPTEHSTAA